MTESHATKSYFPALTGVRAIAAYLVFFHHFGLPAPILENKLNHVLHQGYVGVSMFFVLSGFLIAYRYADARKLSLGWFKEYFWNRARRILPLYWFLLIIVFWMTNQRDPFVWIMCATLTQGFFATFQFTGIPQAWSLTVEENFYFLAPFIFLLHRRIPLGAVLLGIYGFGAALFALGEWLDWNGLFKGFRLYSIYSFYGRAFEFLLGVWLSGVVKRRELALADGNLSARPKELPWFTWAGVITTLGMLLALATYKGEALFAPSGLILHNFVFPVTVALLYWGLITEKSWISRGLGAPLMVFLGQASYAFYLLHHGPTGYAVHNLSKNSIVTFVLINVLAAMAYVLVEKPAHRLLSLGRSKANRAASDK